MFFLLWSADSLADYHLGHVIGRGGFGQVISGSRKIDNLPVSTRIGQLWGWGGGGGGRGGGGGGKEARDHDKKT